MCSETEYNMLTFREKKMSRMSAIKVLNHAMTGKEGADNCTKFVDILGLRSIFPLFMKPPKKHKKGVGPPVEELEGGQIFGSDYRTHFTNLWIPYRNRNTMSVMLPINISINSFVVLAIWFKSYNIVIYIIFFSCPEHLVTIISSMIRNCQGSQLQRLLSKFSENDYEKIDRLMELHFKYLRKVQVADDKIEREKYVSELVILLVST